MTVRDDRRNPPTPEWQPGLETPPGAVIISLTGLYTVLKCAYALLRRKT